LPLRLQCGHFPAGVGLFSSARCFPGCRNPCPYAAESIAAAQFIQELLASGDIDLLYDPRKSLAVVSSRLDGEGLLGLLRRVDKSFEAMTENSYRAINDEGFKVNLIIPQRAMRSTDLIRFAHADLTAAEVPNPQWLANAPAVAEVAIATNGLPVRMKVPDPRAFLICKSWMAN
jgi:Nucleotidyltransferase